MPLHVEYDLMKFRPETDMKFSLASSWALTRPFWVSEERWSARGFLAAVVALDMMRVYLITRINFWQKDFYDALVARDADIVWPLLLHLFILICSIVATDTVRTYLAQVLEMRWRSWITSEFVRRWIRDNTYFRIEQQNHSASADNPDQRIADDLRIMASSVLDLSLGLLKNLVNLVSFSIIVWGLSGTLSVALAGHAIDIPGYMLWAALIYALAGSLLIEKIGSPIVDVDYQQQQCEANFRYLMVRLRENAEQVAFYKGGSVEENRLTASFATVRQNWDRVVDYTKRVTLLKSCYIEAGALVPYLITVPRYFAGLLTVGALMQLNQSFMQVRTSFSWFIFQYKDLALLRSAYRRLAEFDKLLQAEPVRGIAIGRSGDACMHAQKLRLHLPSGEALCSISELCIAPGQRWLVRGPSGVGKSTLLRALAGLWPYGGGRIDLPPGKSMFVPQMNYLPIGSLRACLCYPSEEWEFSEDACIEALRAVRLDGFEDRLGQENDWSGQLSPGEQQRLSFARILLQKPAILFLDEATSSLDLENESHLYKLVIDRLPAVTLVSVAHRPGLIAFHEHVLDVCEGKAHYVEPAPMAKAAGGYR